MLEAYNITMMRLVLRTSVLVLVVSSFIVPGEAWRGSASRSAKSPTYKNQADYEGRRTYKDSKTLTSSTAGNQKPMSRRGLGISAVGIIMVILTLILSGMGFYYFSMCYPLLCKKERNYDKIELESV